MAIWNSEQYLKFKKQRTQPAVDLAKRIPLKNPENIIDIGCGPANSTAVLSEIFPRAEILGVDSSAEMIEKAKEACPNLNFRLCDVVTQFDRLESYDIIFSNACLQWIPNHREFIPKLFGKLNKNGVLAVQMPVNGQEALYKIINEVVSEPQWGFSSLELETNGTLSPEEYFDILSDCTDNFDIWETVYYHNMPSVEAMVEWVKGTRLRPYLNALDKAKAESLEKKIIRRAATVYKAQKNGEIIFRFRRFFFIATKMN